VIKTEDQEPRLHATGVPDDKGTFLVCSWNVYGWQSACDKRLFEHLQKMTGGVPDVLFLQRTKVHQHWFDEPQLTNKLLTLGYRHVKLVASQKHRFAGAPIASKYPFTILPASPVELDRVIAVRVEE
jgi:exonuclease III